MEYIINGLLLIMAAVLFKCLMIIIQEALCNIKNNFILAVIALIIGIFGEAGILYGAYSLLIKPIFNLMDINYYEMYGIVTFIMIIFIDKFIKINIK